MKEERDAERPMMRRMVALLILAVIALAGCDPYYEFKVRNVCDRAVQVALLQGTGDFESPPPFEQKPVKPRDARVRFRRLQARWTVRDHPQEGADGGRGRPGRSTGPPARDDSQSRLRVNQPLWCQKKDNDLVGRPSSPKSEELSSQERHSESQ